MDHEIASLFQPYLNAGESVRWAAMPKQGLTLRRSDLFAIPFTTLLCGFGIFWLTLVRSDETSPQFMTLFGILFVAIGLYLLVGRFFFDSYTRSRTFYALTDRNAFILNGAMGERLTSVDLGALKEVNLRDSTIVFGSDDNALAPFRSRYAPPPSPEFFEIEDAKALFAQLQQVRARAG